MSRTISGLYRDEMAPEKAAKIGYLAAILLRTFEQTDVVERLDDFERAIREDRGVGDLSGWN